MSNWMPIESAPRDGTHIDLWVASGGTRQANIDMGNRYTDARWSNGAWQSFMLDEFDRMSWQNIIGVPTHWMPLPPPPETDDE